MYKVDLTKNLNHIYQVLRNKNMTITAIAKAMGYTTSSQLHSALDGDSQLSTKAVISLIENLKVNPYFLFLGDGEMFLTEESELNKLRAENQLINQQKNNLAKDILKMGELVKQAEDRYNKLIDITSVALENTKKQEKSDNSAETED